MEADNVKDMREALVDVYITLEKLHLYDLHISDITVRRAFLGRLCRAKNVIDTALAKPPRNCDVGTASQQAQRFAELCTSHSKDGARGICDEKCPFYGKEYGSDCALHWAQMPYERGIEE